MAVSEWGPMLSEQSPGAPHGSYPGENNALHAAIVFGVAAAVIIGLGFLLGHIDVEARASVGR
jgi:hypothetical protein